MNPESNYLFGEGGAGTFSDGKLTCRSSGPDVRRVLELFAACKGKPSILYDYRPHLGSNRLPAVVKAFRQRIEAMNVRLLKGRFFDDRDKPIEGRRPEGLGGRPNGAYSIIVDQTLAKRFWPNQDPIGRRMYKPNDIAHGDLTAINEHTVFYTVVGVVGDMKLHDLTEGGTSVGAYYFPMDQDTSSAMTFAIRTAGDPLSLTSAVRGALNGLDQELPVFDTRTMDQQLEKSLVTRRSYPRHEAVNAPIL